jgi:hypothetical protein
MAAEEQELIDSYVNRPGVISDTEFLESELEKVLVKFDQLNALKLKLNIDSSWKDVAATTDQVKKSTDTLVSSMITYRTTQDSVVQGQVNFKNNLTAQNTAVSEAAKQLALLKLEQQAVVNTQKEYAQQLGKGEIDLDEYTRRTAILIDKQNELKAATASLNKELSAKTKGPTPPVDDPTNANIPFTVNTTPADKPGEGNFTETAAEANAAVAGSAAGQEHYAASIKETVIAEEEFVSYTEKVAQNLTAVRLEVEENAAAQKALKQAREDGIITDREYIEQQAKLTVQAAELKTQVTALAKEVSIAAKADFANPGSADELGAQNARLSAERNSLSIVPESAQTDADKERLIEINALLDRNNELIRQNSDALKQQKINIGNYPEQFKIAFAGLEGELTRINTLIDQTGKNIASPQLLAQQKALQNAVGLVDQEFASTAARQNAFKEAGKEIGAVYGTNSQVFKDFATNVAAGTKENKKLGDALSDGATKGSRFSGALGSIFGSLRQIAYILPGIGLAGLFGLLLDPLIAAGNELDLFKNKAGSTADVLQKTNTVLEGTKSSVVKAEEEVSNLRVAFDQAEQGLLSQTDAIKLYNDTVGKTTGAVDSLDEAEKKLAANADAYIKFTLLKAAAQVAAGKAAEQLFEAEITRQKALENFQRITDVPASSASAGNVAAGGPSDADIKAQQEAFAKQLADLKTRREKAAKEFQDQADVLIKIQEDFQKQANELARKFNFFVDRETVAQQVKSSQDAIQLQIDSLTKLAQKSQDTAQKETNTYEIRIAALRRYNDLVQQIDRLQLNKNLLPTIGDAPAEAQVRSTAAIKQQQDQITANNAILALNKEYHDRRVKANFDALQAELEDTAKTNEAIYTDDSRALQDRLDAFKKYISAQKQLNDAAYVEKLQLAGFSSAEIAKIENGDKVQVQGKRITNEELEALTIEHNKKQEELAADSGKKIYDIVITYARAQEKAIKEGNAGNFTGAAQQQYTDQLNALNESLAKQLISVATYEAKKEALEKQYAVIHLATQLEEDNANIDAFEKGKQDLIDEEFSAQQDLQVAIASGNQQEINANQEKLDALRDAEKKFNADIGAARKKAADDQVALFNATSKLLIDSKKQESNDIKKLESAGLDLIKTIINAGYEYRIQAIDNEITDVQKRSAAEITAEQQSGDSAQEQADKIANINAREAEQEKQLNAQKAAEKRKEAEVERLAQIAQITANAIQTEFSLTAKAAEATATGFLLAANPVTAAFAGLAFSAAGAIGADEIIVAGIAAAQIAAILATPLPAYRFGTPESGHPGGWMKVGDGGKSELLEFPDGRLAVSPAHDTYLNAEAGTHVYPDAWETLREMKYAAFGQQVAYMPGMDRQGYDRQMAAEYRQSTNRIIKAITDKQELHIAPGFNSLMLVHQYGASYKKWVGNHLHHRS